MVQALRAERSRGRTRYNSYGGRTLTTDDLGYFRVYGLVPGEYVLAADPAGFGRSDVPSMRAGAGRDDLVMTFAPGTVTTADAQRFVVAAGEEIATDIQLLTGRLVTIFGRAVDSTGTPLTAGSVSVRSEDWEGGPGGPVGQSVAADGTFILPGVRPGAYRLTVVASSRRALSGPDSVAEMEAAYVPIVVDDEDIDGLTITTAPPSSVTGRVVVEGDASALRGQRLYVYPQPIDATARSFSRIAGEVADDRSVRVTGLHGAHLMGLSGLPPGWWVKSVRVNGEDASRGFDFGHGKRWTSLEIVVNDRPASIGGLVTAVAERSAGDYIVLVFPEDLDTYDERVPHTAGWVRTDQTGVYTVSGLRPGTYHAIALAADDVEPGLLSDVDALRALAQRAELVTISEGEQRYLKLRPVDR